MIRIIDEKQDALADICRRCHVARLELFGSAAESERFDATESDLDFLVEFHLVPPGHLFDVFFELRESLEALYHRPVDLLMARAITNPYLRESINKNRVELYASGRAEAP